jgi:asparagine synthase (glutamine-hydrolysing)
MAFCGIAAGSGGRPVQAHELEAMRSSLRPVKGDGKSSWAPHFALGSSAADSSGSFFSSDSLIVACDAELYNSKASGNVAEQIANFYLADGPSFFQKLRGLFSLAIWDRRSRTLMLGVDRIGVKRLFFAERESEIIFATQPGAILSGSRVPKKVNLSAIKDYFSYNVVPVPKTAFEGVTKIAPGEYLLWTDRGKNTKRYWDVRYPEDARGSTQVLARELLTRMELAVKVTSANVDLTKAGCFLSGGTDSSSIVGLLTQLYKRPVNAFSIGFSEDRFNELSYARLAAQHFQANLVEGLLGPEEAFAIIDKIVDAYDEPFGNASAIPTYRCAKLAREHGIDVLFAGDGGDELFGGNERYRVDQMFDFYQRIPNALRRLLEPVIFATPAVGWIAKGQRYVAKSNMPNPERYCQWQLLQAFPPDRVFDSGFPYKNGHSDLLELMRAHYKAAPAKSELNRLLYIDLKITLGDDDLQKVARTAELAGIKVRFPYLDHELIEFAGTVPANLKVRNLDKRYLFKRATSQLLPAAILQKKKHGFGLPIGFWLKSNPKFREWGKQILFDPRTYQRGYFRREFIDEIYGLMEKDDATPYYGDLLWPFLMLELWHRRHVDGGAV